MGWGYLTLIAGGLLLRLHGYTVKQIRNKPTHRKRPKRSVQGLQNTPEGKIIISNMILNSNWISFLEMTKIYRFV